MLLWLILAGGGGALLLAFFAMQGPSASKALKRRIELVKERHGDVIAGNAQAQIRKLMAQRASRIEGYASTLIPKPALLRRRLFLDGHLRFSRRDPRSSSRTSAPASGIN